MYFRSCAAYVEEWGIRNNMLEHASTNNSTELHYFMLDTATNSMYFNSMI